MSLANLKGRQQKPEEMIPYLKDADRATPTDLQTRQWATETLADMEQWVAERDKVDAENRSSSEKYEKEACRVRKEVRQGEEESRLDR